MTQVLVRYEAKPEHIAGHDQVVRTAHDELQRTESGGFQKATFQAGGASGGSRTPTATVVTSPGPSSSCAGSAPVDAAKKHVSHLLGKLGAANRTEAVTRARQLGLIPKQDTTADPGRHRGAPGRLGGTVVPARHCGRFHRHAHLRVTPRGGPGSYRSRERSTQTRRGTPCRQARTWRLAKEMTVEQTRIQRPRARRERAWREALPPDPRDPDVVRAKALARSGHPRRRVPGRAVPVPRPAGT